MLTVQKTLFLRKVDLFAGLSTRELGHVATVAREVIVNAGETIISEGDYGDSLYIIVGGEVEVLRDGASIGRLGEADWFGEMAVLTGETRSATIRAVSDCLLMTIQQPDFHRVLSESFDAVLAVIRTLCRRLKATEPKR